VDILIEQFSERIRQARLTGESLRLQGGGSKGFYGEKFVGSLLEVANFSGVIDYEPSELMLSARCGTPLDEIEKLLAEHGQILGFEPPHFGETATLGGTVACGFSGPRRATAGSLRDHLLGVRIIDGQGQDLRFGGQVMKNVAGYDVSRLMVGALGTLGLLAELTLRVMPKPVHECTLSLELSAKAAIEKMNHLAGMPIPLSATCYVENCLYLRLSGLQREVDTHVSRLGGETILDADQFWNSIREQEHRFFRDAPFLWRFSVPSMACLDSFDELSLIEWGGALRWLVADIPACKVRMAAERVGGHANLFRGKQPDVPLFHPQSSAIRAIQTRLKDQFDPDRVLNRFRMYSYF